jgi:hypothetical protein
MPLIQGAYGVWINTVKCSLLSLPPSLHDFTLPVFLHVICNTCTFKHNGKIQIKHKKRFFLLKTGITLYSWMKKNVRNRNMPRFCFSDTFCNKDTYESKYSDMPLLNQREWCLQWKYFHTELYKQATLQSDKEARETSELHTMWG